MTTITLLQAIEQSPGLCTTALVIQPLRHQRSQLQVLIDAPGAGDAGATLAFTEGDGASVIDATLTFN